MIQLHWPSTVKRDPGSIQRFLQGMCDRLIQGFCRYGPTDKKQRYMSRMLKEVEVYKQTGNAEQLFNIANYAMLEYAAPENKKFHHDIYADSVTRKAIKIV